MTRFNENWESHLSEPYAAFIPDEVFKYRSGEVDAILAWKKKHPVKYPMEVEIGSNRGRFLLGLCTKRKDCHFMGIEVKKSLVRITNNKIKRANCDNAIAINADARLAMPILYEPQSVGAIYVLFPDPWWKKRHAKRKLLNESFFAMAHHYMTEEGFFVLKTDVLDYFNDVKATIEEGRLFEVIDNDTIPNRDLWEPTTRERYCIRDNTPYYTLAARKVQ